MSKAAIDWAIEVVIVSSSQARAARAKNLLFKLAYAHSEREGVASPGRRWLSKATGWSPQTVQRGLCDLEAAGVIEKVAEASYVDQRAAEYTLDLDGSTVYSLDSPRSTQTDPPPVHSDGPAPRSMDPPAPVHSDGPAPVHIGGEGVHLGGSPKYTKEEKNLQDAGAREVRDDPDADPASAGLIDEEEEPAGTVEGARSDVADLLEEEPFICVECDDEVERGDERFTPDGRQVCGDHLREAAPW